MPAVIKRLTNYTGPTRTQALQTASHSRQRISWLTSLSIKSIHSLQCRTRMRSAQTTADGWG